MATDVNASFTLPLSISGEVAVEIISNTSIGMTLGFSGTGYVHELYDLNADIEIPLIETVDSWGYSTILGQADVAVPKITVSSQGYISEYGVADITIGQVTLDTTGLVSITDQASIEIPIIKINSAEIRSEIGVVAINIPSAKVSATAIIWETGTANLTIPMLSVNSGTLEGLSIEFDKSIPIIKLDGVGYTNVLGTADIVIPFIITDIISDVAGTLTICMNVKNKALTQYSNYIFNSFCNFNGKNIGAKDTGLYDLSGSLDGTDNIEWNFRTGLLDLEIGKVVKLLQLWFGYKAAADLKLKVIYSDGQEYEYDIESYSDTEHGSRVKVGKGIKTRYLALDVSGEEPAEFDVIKLHLSRPGSDR